MFDSPILDTVIGLLAVFFVFSLLAAGLRELIARALETRARKLEEKLTDLLDGAEDTGFAKQIIEHPLVKKVDKAVDHISPPDFASALAGVLGAEDADDPAAAYEAVKAKINGLEDKHPLKKPLKTLINESEQKVAAFRAAVEGWFDRLMESMTTWYRRRARWVAFALGIGIAIAFNVNAIDTAHELWENGSVREATSNFAEAVLPDDLGQRVEQCENESNPANCVEDEIAKLVDIGLPIGWACSDSREGGECDNPFEFAANIWNQTFDGDWGNVALRLGGWLLTAAALALGAPFWYDALRRVAGLRRGSTTTGSA